YTYFNEPVILHFQCHVSSSQNGERFSLNLRSRTYTALSVQLLKCSGLFSGRYFRLGKSNANSVLICHLRRGEVISLLAGVGEWRQTSPVPTFSASGCI